jgi:hypothetical protein
MAGRRRDLERITGKLQHEAAGERLSAARTIARLVRGGQIPVERARELIEPLADDANPAVALAAIAALAAVDPLGECSRLDRMVRAILQRGAHDTAFLPAVRTLVAISDDERRTALRQEAEAITRDKPESRQAGNAFWVLSELAAAGDDAALRTLLELAPHAPPASRGAAAASLAHCGRPEAYETVKKMLFGAWEQFHRLVMIGGLAGGWGGRALVERLLKDAEAAAPTKLPRGAGVLRDQYPLIHELRHVRITGPPGKL